MEKTAGHSLVQIDPPSFWEAWEMVAAQLRMEMSRANYESWVQPLRPLSFKEDVYRIGAANAYARDWVQSRLRSRITRLLEGIYSRRLTVHITLAAGPDKDNSPSGGSRSAAPRDSVPRSAAPRAAAPRGLDQDAENTGAGQPGAEDLDVLDDQEADETGDTGDIDEALTNELEPANQPDAAVPDTSTPDAVQTAGKRARPSLASERQVETAPGVGKKNGTVKPRAKTGSGSPAGPDVEPGSDAAELGRSRKIQLQRAYGTERARVIQPERGMFLTMYFFNQWLPLLGHSAMTAIIAARSLCYWNPMTGELRNVVETDMSELARRASVSVRTIKDVLNTELVKKYFLRYRVRRMMTPNGVRTAGILLQVRMDDPLTPEDQQAHNLEEEERWYGADFEDETED